MKRIFSKVHITTGILMVGGCGMLLFGSGCAFWKKSPEQPLLGSRGAVPAPYLRPDAGAPVEPGFEEDTADLDVPEPADLEEPQIEDTTGDEDVRVPPTVDSPTLTYTVKKGDTLWDIAQKYGVSFKELAAYNNMDPDDTLVVGKTLTIPPGGEARSHDRGPDTTTTTEMPEPGSGGIEKQPIPSDRKYTVKSGDSLWVIARKFGVKVSALKRVNDMTSDTIHVGDVLVLPTSAENETTEIAQPEIPSDTEDTGGVPEADTTADDGAPGETTDTADTEPEPDPLNLLEHTVMQGDTLQEIADMYGTTVNAIKRANPDVDSDEDLAVNMTIKVPFD